MTASPLLQVTGRTVQLSGRPVLQGLSFTLPPVAKLAVLARALTKHPPLQIPDEPCQGLDSGWFASFIALGDTICAEMLETLNYMSRYKGEILSCVARSLRLGRGGSQYTN